MVLNIRGSRGRISFEIAVERGEQFSAALVGIRKEQRRIVVHRVDAGADRPLRVTGGAQHRIEHRVDLGDLGEAGAVNLLARHLGRRVRLDPPIIISLALRQPPAAGIVRGAAAKLLKHGDLAIERLRDRAGDQGAGARRVIAGEVRLPGAANQRGDQRGLGRRRRAQPLEIADRLVEDEIGRDDAKAGIVADALGFLVEIAGEGFEPREIIIRVGGVVDRMLGVEEIGDGVIIAAELA